MTSKKKKKKERGKNNKSTALEDGNLHHNLRVGNHPAEEDVRCVNPEKAEKSINPDNAKCCRAFIYNAIHLHLPIKIRAKQTSKVENLRLLMENTTNILIFQ